MTNTTKTTIENAIEKRPCEFEVHYADGRMCRHLGLFWEYERYILPQIIAGTVEKVYAVFDHGRYRPRTKEQIDIEGLA